MDRSDNVTNGKSPEIPGDEVPAQPDGFLDANGELLPALYHELRRMAAAKMARERIQTMQATALVHEAWLKLGQQRFESRAHFFGAAAEAMRRILVERARRRNRIRHGAGMERAEYEESRLLCPIEDSKLLQVHEVLEELEQLDALKARIVKLRFFAGLENGEIAALLDVNEKTVRRHWQVAKVLLYRLIRGTTSTAGGEAAG